MRLINRLAEVKRWLGNGQGFFMDFRYPVLLAIGAKVYLPTWSLLKLGVLAVFLIIFLIFLGYLDDRYFKFNQTLAQISTEKYNPYFRKLKKRFK